MADMYDAENPANIPAFLDGAPALRITVLADPAGEAFDAETGNAGNDQVAQAINVRHDRGEWSVGYTNEDNHAALTQALAARGLEWSDAGSWPAPGVYLWAAAPGLPNGARPSWATVEPLAVQNRWTGPTDVSWVQAFFPARVAGYIDGAVSAWPAAEWARFREITTAPPQPPQKPPQPPQEVCNVQVPVLVEGSQGSAVKAAQTLLGAIAIDGVFGPATKARVEAYQSQHGLAVDGVVGLHTWGQLLGAPQ